MKPTECRIAIIVHRIERAARAVAVDTLNRVETTEREANYA